jgi:alpha-glucosidase
MKILKFNFLISIIIIFSFNANCIKLYAKTYDISSPNKKIKVQIKISDKINYSLFFDSKVIIKPSSISLTINEGIILGKSPKVMNLKNNNINEKICPVVPEKRKVIKDQYNEKIFDFEGGYGLVFRVYNDGAAYRFVTKFKNDIKIVSEETCFKFAKNDSIYFPFEDSFMTHSERLYSFLPVSEITSKKWVLCPRSFIIRKGLK